MTEHEHETPATPEAHELRDVGHLAHVRSEGGSVRTEAVRHPVRHGVYLAGPSGFSAPGTLWHDTVLVPKVREAGLVPVDPWSQPSPVAAIYRDMEYGEERLAALRAANLEQGRLDLRLVRESEAVLASLDGQDVDSGTAVEIGYAFALGLVIVGIRTDWRRTSDNEASDVNLMIETCIAESGGILTRDVDEAVAHLAAHLAS